AAVVQRAQHRNPGRLVLALQFGQGGALARRDRARLVQHDRDEIAARPQQHVEVIADQDAQARGGIGLRGLRTARLSPPGGCGNRALLARDGRPHAFLHHRIEQRALALEVIEGRAALHAHRGRDIACAGAAEALAPEERGRATEQLLAPVAVVAVLWRLARPPARAFGAAVGCAAGGGALHGRTITKPDIFSKQLLGKNMASQEIRSATAQRRARLRHAGVWPRDAPATARVWRNARECLAPETKSSQEYR